MSTNRAARHRYRIRFGKQGALRYISHLDVARVWERVLRRAGVAVVHSQGYNPRPKLQLAAALPLGYASTCELVDIWLEGEAPDEAELLAALRRVAPEGLSIESIEEVDLKGPALQTLTRAAVYRVELEMDVGSEALRDRLTDLLAEVEIRQEQRGKSVDIRPLIHAIEVVGEDPVRLSMELALSQEGGMLRPDRVLEALGIKPETARITRVAMRFKEA